MVDLSKAKAGDTVKFRCGGQAVIARRISGNELTLEGFDLGETDYRGYKANCWYADGSYSTGNHPLDIIEIVSAPFDWSTVKPGMAFLWDGEGSFEENLRWYIGPMKDDKWAFEDNGGNPRIFYGFNHLKRALEHDIKITT